MDMELTVEQKLVLYVNGKHCIPEQKYVDGETFMHLKKWDRALVKTMTGKSLDLRPGKSSGSLNIDMRDEMIRARQDKANELLQQALNTEEDAAIENKRKSKKPQVVKAQSKYALVLPLKFTISVQGHEFQVLFDGIGTKSVRIEMSEVNLKWLKSAVDRTSRPAEDNEQEKSDDENDEKNEESSSENK